MQVSKFFPIPLLVAVIAFVYMWAAAQFNLIGWIAFITWGGYFLSGVSSKSAVREAISVSLGIILGAVIVLLATALSSSLGTLAVPIIVAVAAFVIVFLELVPWFDMAPGYFLGAAVFFGAGAKPDMATITAAWIPAVVGIVLGVLTGYMRGLILSAQGAQDTLKKATA
ncbi:MAG: Glutathione-regulated potassium-efflux system protein [Candidatus Daviesbacteria bacterium GW2011_GWC1_40_9]|nr:MAG: Glutathione-regulated potassium-efflux system protein [Candidatus Daviesbacteria bacterium GW2011_GWC1_40_9]